jgi:hypothetical protein
VSVYLGGKNEWNLSLRPFGSAARGMAGRIRRRLAADPVGTHASQGRPRRVELSEWAHALDALRSLPLIAPADVSVDGAAQTGALIGAGSSSPLRAGAHGSAPPFAAVQASHTSPGRGAPHNGARGVSRDERTGG